MERIPLYSFVGPEGSGKSTHAKLLAFQLGIPCVSTGDMIRGAAANDSSEIGDECRQILRDHVYLSGPTLLKMIAKRLQQQDVDGGVVLDGGFRTIKETEDFSKALALVGREFGVKIFYLRIPFWEAYDRLLNGEKRERKDDTIEGITSRLNEFRDKLVERMHLLRDTWGMVTVIASGKAVEKVNGEIMEKLQEIETVST